MCKQIVWPRGRACVCASSSLFLSVVLAIPVRADLMREWVERTRAADSLYFEGRVDSYRVPANLSSADPNNWRQQPEICPSVEFKGWLLRPGYRLDIKAYDPLRPEKSASIERHSWLNGRLSIHGGIGMGPDAEGGSILAQNRSGIVLAVPILTPLELHFFDWPTDDAPRDMSKRPYQADGDTLSVELVSPDEHGAGGSWTAIIELDRARGLAPRRMMLHEDAKPGQPIRWECEILAYGNINGFHVTREAQMMLSNPNVLAGEQVVYKWTTTTLEYRPIVNADLELTFPEGMPIMDFTTNTRWTIGNPSSVRKVDPEEMRIITETVRAQIEGPELRTRRSRAMGWIVGAALVATGLALHAIRRLRLARTSGEP